MARQQTLYLTLSVACFGIVWSIYEMFLSRMSLENGKDAGPFLGLLSAIGLFVLLFNLAMKLSDTLVQNWLSDEAVLVGSWFQILEIHNLTTATCPADMIRHGRVTLSLVNGILEITAENRKLDPMAPPSSWYSNKISIQGHQMWLLFTSMGPGRGSTHGNMLLYLRDQTGIRRRPARLEGYFADSSPATHYGSIELFRKESEFDERKKAYAARVPPVAIYEPAT
jgi:hypothetical protein